MALTHLAHRLGVTVDELFERYTLTELTELLTR